MVDGLGIVHHLGRGQGWGLGWGWEEFPGIAFGETEYQFIKVEANVRQVQFTWYQL